MPEETAAADGASDRWHDATLALLAGLAVASSGFFLIAALQPTGLDPPPESAALFLVATTASAISYHLLGDGRVAGYPVAMLTGAFVLVAVGLLVTGTYGPAGPRTNPVGPVSYVALSLAVVVTAGLAWRRGSASGSASTHRSVS